MIRKINKSKPGIRIFNKYVLLGIEQEFIYIKINETGEEIQDGLPFSMLYPTKRKLRRRSKYMPHQGTQEINRRL